MKFFALIIFISLLVSCNSQKPIGTDSPYADAIAVFKKTDSARFPPYNAILFIGSSSFTLWKDVQNYFPGYTIINRGFGGSTLADQILYARDIIFPYRPRQIVMYCGENDLAFDSVSASVVFERFKTLFQMIREKFADLPLVYLSMKPSPSRRVLLPAMRAGNKLIRDYLSTQPHTVFIDIHKEMLQPDGEPRGELFIDDSLHMNASGYQIWQKSIAPYLIKD